MPITSKADQAHCSCLNGSQIMPRFCCKIAVVVDENWMMRRRSQSVKVPIGRTVGLALSSAVIMSGISEIKVARSQPMPSLQLNIATSIAHPPLADGIYLYGDVPQANQLGQGYVVFKKNGSTVTGAFFILNLSSTVLPGISTKSA